MIRTRLASLTAWLTANLREKTVLFVGFWTDWAYLGAVLAKSVHAVHIPLIVLASPVRLAIQIVCDTRNFSGAACAPELAREDARRS